MHMCARSRTCLFTRAGTCMHHAYAHVCGMHEHLCTLWCYMHTHAHMNIHLFRYARTCVCVHTLWCYVCVHVYECACMHSHVHAWDILAACIARQGLGKGRTAPKRPLSNLLDEAPEGKPSCVWDHQFCRLRLCPTVSPAG